MTYSLASVGPLTSLFLDFAIVKNESMLALAKLSEILRRKHFKLLLDRYFCYITEEYI